MSLEEIEIFEKGRVAGRVALPVRVGRLRHEPLLESERPARQLGELPERSADRRRFTRADGRGKEGMETVELAMLLIEVGVPEFELLREVHDGRGGKEGAKDV